MTFFSLRRFSFLLALALGVSAASCSLQDFGRFHAADTGPDAGPDMTGDTGVDMPDMMVVGTTYRMTLVRIGNGMGTVSSSPPGINCGTDCDQEFADGTLVTLTAMPALGSRFVGWNSGGCAGTGTCIVQMNQARIIQAEFELSSAVVTLTIDGDGTGGVVSSPAGITCDDVGGTCTATFNAGDTVTLTATPTGSSTFAGWSGDCAGSSTCIFVVTKPFRVGASFDGSQRSLLVSRAGTGGGTVTSTDGMINCGTDCANGYSGGSVTLTAVADDGSTFAGWSGDCVGTNPLCTVSMDSVRRVSATFTLQRHDVTILPQGTGVGTVTSFPMGIDCGATCAAAFDDGQMVTLVATPAMGSTFGGWSGGGCTGTGATCMLTVTQAVTIQPTFTLNQYVVMVAKTGSGTGTVISEPTGIVCGPDCMQPYGHGMMVTLTAVADTGSSFSGWTGACTGAMPTCTLTVTQAANVTAGFTKGTHPVNVVMSGDGMGSVTADVGGIDCGTVCEADIDSGTMVTFTATEMTGATFAGWGGDCSGTATTCTLTITRAMTVSATFTTGSDVLTITKTGAGTGTVSSAPVGIDCGETCAASFTTNTMVDLVATPGPGSTFEGWSGGGCSGTGTCTVTVSGSVGVTADFSLMTVTLTTTKDGTGTGTITSTPAGIDCGAMCTATLDFGTMVTLTAMADAESIFTGWTGAGCTGIGPCMVTLGADASVNATFELRTYPMTITKGGTGAGSVTTNVAGLDCGSDCMEDVPSGTMITLTAVPQSTSNFTGWSGGGCMGTDPCTVTVTAATTVSASFALKTYGLTVAKSGSGTGTVASMDMAVNCGADCSEDYAHGTMVTLTATPNASSTFAGWSGACSGTADCTVTIESAQSVTATFTLRSYALTAMKTGTGSGTVTSAPTGIVCGPTCTSTFDHGAMVTLTATPDASSTFTGWAGGGCTGTGSCSVTLTSATMVTATFTINTYVVTVAKAGNGMGTVSATGINCGADCMESYDADTMVTLTAAPALSSSFTGWSGGGCSGTGSCMLTVSAATTVTATFALVNRTLTVTKSGTGTGSVSSMPVGVSCGADCTEDFLHGTMVTLTAAADPSSTFTGWSGGGCTGTATTCMVTMNAATTVNAAFALAQRTLTVSLSGTGMGSVGSMPAGINCGPDCTQDYAHGTMVTLTATPVMGSSFAGWGGACTGTGTCMVTMDQAQSVTAVFTLGMNVLTVSKAGTGDGTVTSNPAGINCGSTCGSGFSFGQMVTLTATPTMGSTFTGWSGGGCSGTGTCTVTMNSAQSVTATFTLNTYIVTVTKNGTGTGTVTSVPMGISCGSDCTETLGYGTMVALTAVADPSSDFAGWSGGGCSGTGACMVTVSAATTVTATFTIKTYVLTVTKSGTGTGTVNSVPAGINCGPDCMETLDHNEMITLTANDGAGSTFTGWSGGGCTGTGSCVITATAATTVTASFTLGTNPLNITKAGTGAGTVSSMPAGIDCGSTCSTSFDYGTMVTLTAVASPGSTFSGWLGSLCTGTGTCTVTMTTTRSVTATFTLNTYPVTVTKAGNGAGTVTSTPAGIDCGATCSDTFGHGTMVTLTAAASTGSTFTGWSGTGGCTGTGACMLTVTAARAATATFTLNTHTVTVTKAGTGTGTVSSMPAGTISCGADCTETVDYGTMLTLTAAPDATSTFTGWSGGGCMGTGTCTVTVTAATTVTATFTLATRTLTVVRAGTGTGAVTSAPGGINCGADCTEGYDHGTAVILTASPDVSSTFTGWSGGGCSGTGTCMVTMNAATTVTATFAIRTYTLTVTPSGTGTGTVTSVPGGISCGADCAEVYDHGEVITLTPMAGMSSTFAGWGGACSGTGTCMVTMTAATSVTATFTLGTNVLTVVKAGTGDGTVTSVPAGISCGATCGAAFTIGQMVTLTAVPTTGSTFTGWSGGGCAGTGTCMLTLNMATTVTATFTLNTYALDVTLAGNGTGTVTSMPTGISCGVDCSESYGHGTMVTLSAAPAMTSDFMGWSGGGCSGTAPCTVSMTAARTVTATFVLKTYSLTVSKNGTGTGTVTSTVPAGGISCGADCSETYNHGTMVTLSAAPDPTSAFTGWSGGGCSGTGTCMTTITAATSVTATFTLALRTLTVTKNGTGTGSVTSAPAGVTCGADCTEGYDHGTMVVLTATPDATSNFTGWSGGGCTGTGTCMVTMTAATTVTATFTLKTYSLGVTKAGTGAGTVTSMPTGINCGATCSDTFDHGTVVTLTAAASIGSTFTGWGGACSGVSPTCMVTMDMARSATATFTLNTYTLTVSKVGTGTGTVTSTVPAGGGISCGADCNEAYDYGTMVTLTAAQGVGSTFTGWSGGGCTGTGSCMTTITAATTVTATFTLTTHTLTVTKVGTGMGTVSSPPVINCGADCMETVNYGTMLTLTAAASTGSTFTGWSGGGCAGTGTCVVTVTAATTVTATFTLNTYSLTASVGGTGTGTVSSMPAGILNCGGANPDCSQVYNYGTMVTLTQTPGIGATFSGWGGACTGTGACVVTMDQAQSVTATFTLITYTLTAAKAGTGAGTVTSMPAGINCGVACAASFNYGTVVTLTATPSVGSTFGGWSGGGCVGPGSTCMTTITAATTVTATFTLNTYTLSVTKAGNGAGTVTSMTPGINCGADCNEVYGHGTMVSLTAAPDISSNFTGWSGGGCSGTGTCLTTVTAATTVTATFTLKTYALTVTLGGGGGGTVSTVLPSTGIACGVDCTETYNHGTMVMLSAAPDATSTFGGWSGGGCSGTGTCTVTMTAAQSVTATFDKIIYPLTVSKAGTGTGTVSSSPPGITCGSNCMASWSIGTMVTLTAAPDASSNFTGWSGGGCSGTGTCVVTLNMATAVTASFTLKTYTLTASVSGNGAGTVSSMPAGIANCGGAAPNDCSEVYNHGQMITLTAAPSVSSNFTGWSGGGCSGTGSCIVTLTAATNVTATFTLKTYTLTVTKSGSGMGTVTSGEPTPLINCGAACNAVYNHGSVITLSASPNVGQAFGGWSGGGCTGPGACVVTITSNTTVNAQFLASYNVSVTLTGDGIGGTTPYYVASSPSGIACRPIGGDCSQAWIDGTQVTLYATGPQWANFVSWVSGPCAGTSAAQCTFTVTAAQTIQARFDRVTNLIFATSATFGGHELNGVGGADAYCNQIADAANLPGIYYAWISYDGAGPASRIRSGPNGWILPNGALVARDWADLTDGVLNAPINIDENGAAVTAPAVAWTNTNIDGNPTGTVDCFDWMLYILPLSGRVGSTASIASTWTSSGSQSCTSQARLYCLGTELDRPVPTLSNDLCAGAITLTPPNGTRNNDKINYAADNDSLVCANGADIWYRITVPTRSVLYFDSFGSSFDTKLTLRNACNAAAFIQCQDDDCGFAQEQLVADVSAGTYYLGLHAYSAATLTGTVKLHWETLTAGSGVSTLITANGNYSGVISAAATSVVAPVGCIGGGGSEDLYYFSQCPNVTRDVTANTCTGTTWDTTLHIRNGNNVERSCNDDSAGCGNGNQSLLPSTSLTTPGIFGIYMDAYAAGTGGAYTLNVSGL